MFLFYVLSFFKKGDTIQGGTLFKGGHYLRKHGICQLMIPIGNMQKWCPILGRVERSEMTQKIRHEGVSMAQKWPQKSDVIHVCSLNWNYCFISDIVDWILHRDYSWHEKSWRMAKLSHDPRNSLSNGSFCRGSLRINENLRTNCQWGLESFSKFELQISNTFKFDCWLNLLLKLFSGSNKNWANFEKLKYFKDHKFHITYW